MWKHRMTLPASTHNLGSASHSLHAVPGMYGSSALDHLCCMSAVSSKMTLRMMKASEAASILCAVVGAEMLRCRELMQVMTAESQAEVSAAVPLAKESILPYPTLGDSSILQAGKGAPYS